MPKLVRLYITSVCIGFAIAAVFVVLLLGFDVAGIGHLILGSSIGPLAAAMLVVFNGIVFSGVQFAIAVARMAKRDDPPPRRGRLIPAPVVAGGGNRSSRGGVNFPRA